MLRVLGWRALLIHGDPCVLDRWLWLRAHLRGGNARTFDAGAGNGGFSIYAARAGNDVVAASFSERELESVRHRADQLGVLGIERATQSWTAAGNRPVAQTRGSLALTQLAWWTAARCRPPAGTHRWAGCCTSGQRRGKCQRRRRREDDVEKTT